MTTSGVREDGTTPPIEVRPAKGKQREKLITENARILQNCKTPEDLRQLIWNLAALLGGILRGNEIITNIPDRERSLLITLHSRPATPRTSDRINPWVFVDPDLSEDRAVPAPADGAPSEEPSPVLLREAVYFAFTEDSVMDYSILTARVKCLPMLPPETPRPTSYVTDHMIEPIFIDVGEDLGPETIQAFATNLHTAWEQAQVVPPPVPIG